MSSKPASHDHNEGKVQRLFFALWPDEKIRQQIISRRQSIEFHGRFRPVKTDNLHLTLAFLGNVNPDQQSCVERMAGQVQGAPFTISVDKAGYWHKPRIIWIGPDTMPESMVALATTLRDEAIKCGIEMDMRSYNAHITLLRKITKQKIENEITPFKWEASSFVLVKSTSSTEGLIYDVINEWPLKTSD